MIALKCTLGIKKVLVNTYLCIPFPFDIVTWVAKYFIKNLLLFDRCVTIHSLSQTS